MPAISKVAPRGLGSVLLSCSIVAALLTGFPRAANSADDKLLPSSQPGRKSAAKPTIVAKVGATKGWATFGLALPAGVAWESLKVGSNETQSDVKTRWSDGSIRFSVVTAWISRPGIYDVWTAPENRGTFQPHVPRALVRLMIAGRPWMAELPDQYSEDIWLAGPLAAEWRTVVSPIDAGRHSHPFLRVFFDVRCYSDGTSRVDITVDNSLDAQGATALTYDVDVRMGEKTVFRKEKVTHYYLTRWRKVFAVNATVSDVTPDFEPFFRAKALPRYLSLVVNQLAKPEGPSFDILQKGSLHPDMPDHGGRPELAPYPDWTVRYIVHKNPVQGRYVLAHGDLAGSWPVHMREPETGRYRGVGKSRLVSIDERPNYWLDSRADVDGRPQGDLTARGPLRPDNAHVPSLAYVPYLITGDRYYADEMSYWGNYVLLATFQDRFYKARGSSDGLLASNETRGIAWGLRNMVDAAAYLPDGDAVKIYLAQKVINNLKWADNYAENHVTPLGTYFERPGSEGTVIEGLWQNNYVAWSLDHANKQGFPGGEKLRDRLARFQLSLLTSRDFERSYAGAYYLTVGTKTGDDQITYFATLKEVFDKTYGKPPQPPTPLRGYYGVDARLALIIAYRQNWPGARDAYDYVHTQITTSPEPNGIADLALRAGWAIAFDKE